MYSGHNIKVEKMTLKLPFWPYNAEFKILRVLSLIPPFFLNKPMFFDLRTLCYFLPVLKELKQDQKYQYLIQKIDQYAIKSEFQTKKTVFLDNFRGFNCNLQVILIHTHLYYMNMCDMKLYYRFSEAFIQLQRPKMVIFQ